MLWPRSPYSRRSCDSAALTTIAWNTAVCGGARMVGVGHVDWAAFESAGRPIGPHGPMPLRLIRTADPGISVHQRGSAVGVFEPGDTAA